MISQNKIKYFIEILKRNKYISKLLLIEQMIIKSIKQKMHNILIDKRKHLKCLI